MGIFDHYHRNLLGYSSILYNTFYIRKKLNMKQLIYMFIAGIIITSCYNPKNENTTKENIKKEVSEAIKLTKAYTIEEKDSLLQEYEVKQDNTKTQIGDLKRKLVNIKDIRKQTLEEKVNDLERRQEKCEKKIAELKGCSESAYHDIKIILDSTMSELDNAIEEAGKEFN